MTSVFAEKTSIPFFISVKEISVIRSQIFEKKMGHPRQQFVEDFWKHSSQPFVNVLSAGIELIQFISRLCLAIIVHAFRRVSRDSVIG